MIEVTDLKKDYGPVAALRGVSFQVGRGEVVGFVGPNGAGKSTTLRILTGYIGATSGSVRSESVSVVMPPLYSNRGGKGKAARGGSTRLQAPKPPLAEAPNYKHQITNKFQARNPKSRTS